MIKARVDKLSRQYELKLINAEFEALWKNFSKEELDDFMNTGNPVIFERMRCLGIEKILARYGPYWTREERQEIKKIAAELEQKARNNAR